MKAWGLKNELINSQLAGNQSMKKVLTFDAAQNSIQEVAAFNLQHAYADVLSRKRETIKTRHFCFVKTKSNCFTKLNFDDILYVEALRSYCRLTVSKAPYTIMLSCPMADVADKLDNGMFCRIHRSYIVNLNHIDAIEDNLVVVQEHKFPVGLSFKDELFKLLNVL